MLISPPSYWHHQPPEQPNAASFLRLVCLWLLLSAVSAPLPGRSGFTLLECSSNRQYHGESRWLRAGSVGWPEMPAPSVSSFTQTALSWLFSSTFFFFNSKYCKDAAELDVSRFESKWRPFVFVLWRFEISFVFTKGALKPQYYGWKSQVFCFLLSWTQLRSENRTFITVCKAPCVIKCDSKGQIVPWLFAEDASSVLAEGVLVGTPLESFTQHHSKSCWTQTAEWHIIYMKYNFTVHAECMKSRPLCHPWNFRSTKHNLQIKTCL